MSQPEHVSTILDRVMDDIEARMAAQHQRHAGPAPNHRTTATAGSEVEQTDHRRREHTQRHAEALRRRRRVVGAVGDYQRSRRA